MATREENLKKINDELEQLSDEELENVAGGTIKEMEEDAERFRSLNIPIYVEKGGSGMMEYESLTVSLAVEFEKQGVNYRYSSSNPNQYFIDGKQVSRDEAWKHIYSKLKK